LKYETFPLGILRTPYWQENTEIVPLDSTEIRIPFETFIYWKEHIETLTFPPVEEIISTKSLFTTILL
jgi:hypothetical protein